MSSSYPYLDLIGEPVFLLDDRGQAIHMNPAATRFAKDLPRGQRQSVQGLETLPGFSAFLTQGPDGGEPVHRIFEPVPQKKYLFKLYPSPSGERLLLISDIVQGAEGEPQLKKAVEALMRSNADLEQFAQAASHDLQEPLRSISNFTKLIKKRLWKTLDEKSQRHIAFILESTERMKELIADLLSYSKANRKNQHFTQVDLDVEWAEALDLLKESIASSNAAIRAPRLPAIEGLPRQWRQVFQNLLSNAIKYRGSAPPRIELSCEGEGEQWHLSLRDNGIGIEKPYLDKIFAMFQRLHDRSAYPGTGIGLTLCKKIVDNHRGKIWAESEHGQGSTFHITLPKALKKTDWMEKI